MAPELGGVGADLDLWDGSFFPFFIEGWMNEGRARVRALCFCALNRFVVCFCFLLCYEMDGKGRGEEWREGRMLGTETETGIPDGSLRGRLAILSIYLLIYLPPCRLVQALM